MYRTRTPSFFRATALLLLGILALWPVAGAGNVEQSAGSSVRLARKIIALAGTSGGLVIHLGCGQGDLTAALRPNERYTVHGLDTDARNVEVARSRIRELGIYGKVAVDHWSGRLLPYIDNFANLIVVSAGPQVAAEELLRVLAPGGVVVDARDEPRIVARKPWPEGIDEWTHHLHGPDNNAVAQDTMVGPPKHYQWIGSPDYLRHHDHLSGLSAMVSAAGRLFYIMDLGPRWSVQMPPKWTLVARDAFNGTILWQRRIEHWHPHLWPLKRGPAQLMRRLVAEGNRVYVTLGVGAPVCALDAATGETIGTYAGTEGAEELVLCEGVLFVVVNPELDAYKTIPKDTVESIRRAGRQWNWDEKPRRILAINTASGKTLWTQHTVIAPGTLAADGAQVYFHDGEKVVCLQARSGRQVWTSKPVPRWKPMHVLFSPTLIVHDDVVLFAGGEKMDPLRGGQDTMTALSASTGRVLWTAPHPPSGYASAEDLFVIGGLVWCGITTSPRHSGVFTGRDLHTGEVKEEFPPDPWRHMPHHRCHRAKATCRFILTSRTGIEFVDMRQGRWTPHFWVRGSCNYGILPCNGLIYAGPHSCACFLLAKLNGMNALAAQSPSRKLPESIPDADRFQRGPAYATWHEGDSPPPARDAASDWPTFRHDMARSGATSTPVPSNLRRSWRVDIGGKLSALTLADGRLFVAAIDTHTLHAIDAFSGKKLWSFTAGGRIDSPPTIWQRRVLFGSADGHVYCLHAADGALLWRFRAAPVDRRLVAHEQLESVWPVHGSVLVHQGVVYCVAGRSMWLDGGLRLLRLDAATGRKLSETVMDDKFPGTHDSLQKGVRWPNLPVALPDVLSCDGRYVYMRSQPLDLEGKRSEVVTPRDYTQQQGPTAHLFSPTGFLDDSFWHRTYWIWGRSYISAAGGWQLATYRAPTGRILVCDDSSVYGFGEAPLRAIGTPRVYHLFSCAKEPQIVNPYPNQKPRRIGMSVFGKVIRTRPEYHWSHRAPLLVRAMVVAGDTLFAAGPPAVVDEQQVYTNYGDPAVQAKMAEHVAAFEGKRGGLLMAVSKTDGTQLAAYRLPSPPVFDGVIAAGGRLYLAAMNGAVLCLASEGQPLPPVPEAKLGPAPELPRAARLGIPFRPTESHPDFQWLSQVQITPSKLGYHMQAPRGEFGIALKKLPKPITGKVTFRVEVIVRPGAPTPDTPGNGFLVFGSTPNADNLVMCGYRISGKSLSITQGRRSLTPARKAKLQANTATALDVTVDVPGRKVTLSAAGEQITAPLSTAVEPIQWVGYAVQSVDADFSPLQIERQ